MLDKVKTLKVTLYGSLAATGKGSVPPGRRRRRLHKLTDSNVSHPVT